MEAKFENIKLKNIRSFISILNDKSSRDINYVKRIYENQCRDFEELIAFFTSLKLLKLKNKEIKITNSSLLFHSEKKKNYINIKEILIDLLTNGEGDLSKKVLNFLNKFIVIDNEDFIYKPKRIDRIKESSLRNFLIELEIIKYNSINDHYIIEDNSIVLERLVGSSTLSPKKLKLILDKQAQLGFAAEKFVVKFEKKRLKDFKELRNKIEHTSQIDTYAGFDIKSFEKKYDSTSRPIARFIEVKAVSLLDYKFYWSKNEIEKAKELSNRYYLYLIPVKDSKTFYEESIKIIRNPYKELIDKENEWNNAVELYSFWKDS